MNKVKKRVFDIIQIGSKTDVASKMFDIFIVLMIFINLFCTFFQTFKESVPYADSIYAVELITSIIFAIEYVLRFWTADYLFPGIKPWSARFKYFISFFGIIDLLAFLPFFLPAILPSGIVAFRILRVVRIFRLFRLNAQYDAFNIITDVIKEKKDQLLSSLVIIVILMLASSMIMYSLENEAQPEQFSNAFSGIWWSMSTLLTVGYGDIYPITLPGKIMAIVIAFLGVGMVSIPTGIISAGFVEHYSKMTRLEKMAEELPLSFLSSKLGDSHIWCNKRLDEVILPPGILVMLILRNDESIVPKGETVFKSGDQIILCSANSNETPDIQLRKVIIKEDNPWAGEKVKNIDISRRELIALIKRKNKSIVPTGKTTIYKGDVLFIYSDCR